MNFCLRNNPARLLAAAGGGRWERTADGGWQGEEEGRLHFRDPCSGYTVIPRDVVGESTRERDSVKEGAEGGKRRMRETSRDMDEVRRRWRMHERGKGTDAVA